MAEHHREQKDGEVYVPPDNVTHELNAQLAKERGQASAAASASVAEGQSQFRKRRRRGESRFDESMVSTLPPLKKVLIF